MAIERALSPLPENMQGEGVEVDFEIEIVDPKMVTLDDGSVEITLVPDSGTGKDGEFDANIAEDMEEDELSKLADEVIGLVDADVDSRKDWADTFVKGLDVLGFKHEERSEPWEGACGVYSTVLSEAAIRFQSGDNE